MVVNLTNLDGEVFTLKVKRNPKAFKPSQIKPFISRLLLCENVIKTIKKAGQN